MLVFLDGQKTKVIQFLKLSQICTVSNVVLPFLNLNFAFQFLQMLVLYFLTILKKLFIQLVVDTFPDSTFVVIYKRLCVISQEPLKHILKHEQSFNIALLISSLANFHLFLKICICSLLLIKLFFTKILFGYWEQKFNNQYYYDFE